MQQADVLISFVYMYNLGLTIALQGRLLSDR
jgi:hypothetical protein